MCDSIYHFEQRVLTSNCNSCKYRDRRSPYTTDRYIYLSAAVVKNTFSAYQILQKLYTVRHFFIFCQENEKYVEQFIEACTKIHGTNRVYKIVMSLKVSILHGHLYYSVESELCQPSVLVISLGSIQEQLMVVQNLTILFCFPNSISFLFLQDPQNY